MEGDTRDIQKNEDRLMNANNGMNPSNRYDLSKSRNLFRKKDGQCLAVLSSGKWFQIFKNSPKVSCHEFSTSSSSSSPSHFLRKLGATYKDESYQSEKMHEKVISLARKTISSRSIDIFQGQGTLQFTKRANGMPRFVFKLDNQQYIYVASLSSNVYMIHLQRGESSSSSSLLVGRIKVSSGSLLNGRFIERKFVLFSNNGEHSHLSSRKKNRGFSKKVVDVIKNNRSILGLRCSCDDEHLEEANFDDEQVNIMERNLPPNLETLAVVVKQEFLEEESGGWGLKFLKKSSLVQTKSGSSGSLTSMDVVIPSGIHGGPEDGPSSLIERWQSQGNCDCEGWDLGCSLTLLKGQRRQDNLFELFIEGSKHETPGLRIVNVGRGRHFVQFKTRISVLHSFSIALALIHSQSQELRLLHT